MSDAKERLFVAQIRSEFIGAEKDAWLFLSSPDIPGFFLCYEDPEQSYRLIEPLAKRLIWDNLRKSVRLREFDRQLLREKGIALVVFSEANGPPEISPALERYGMFMEYAALGGTIFLPHHFAEGKDYFRRGLIEKIFNKNILDIKG